MLWKRFWMLITYDGRPESERICTLLCERNLVSLLHKMHSKGFGRGSTQIQRKIYIFE